MHTRGFPHLFFYWSCYQYAAAMPPYLLLPPLLVSCSDQQNHIYPQRDDQLHTSCLWGRDPELHYLRATGLVSRTGKEQTELPSSQCHWYWSSTFVHNMILWSGRIVLGPNLARRDMHPPHDSNHVTIQCVSPSCTVPACLHRNLSIEVFGQEVHLFLLWPLTLPVHEWQPVQLGWCAGLNTSSWRYHYSSRWGSPMALLLPTSYSSDPPPSAHCHSDELHHTCTSYFNYHLIVHYTHQGLYISSLHIKQGPRVSLSQDLKVEPTLLHIFSIRSKVLSIFHKATSLSWSLLPLSSQKIAYRLLDAKCRGVWSTFYNPYALQNNYSTDHIPQHLRKKVVASVCFYIDEAWLGELNGELGYYNGTLNLTLRSEPPVYLTFNTQKIKIGTYFFSRTQGLYYSIQERNATDATGNRSSIHYIFYQQQSLSYLITIEFVQLRWYKFNLHLYLNRKGALVRTFSEKDIEIHIFNSGPSFLQSLVYIVWFIPLQHPLLQCEWTFNLQLFDSRKEYFFWNDTYAYRDRVKNAAHFIPRSALPFNPALYDGFVAQMNCTRSGHTHAILKATVNTYASKVVQSTVACLQRICLIKEVKIQKSDCVLNFSKRVPFTLSADTQMNCSALKQKVISWKIYKVPDVKTTPDWSKPFNPPGIGRKNLIKLEVPGSILDEGLYLFNLTVKLTTMDTLESVEGSDSVFVKIGSGSLVAVIAGGNLQTVGSSNQWTLDGSSSSDSDATQPFEGLIFTWYCTKQKADYISMNLSVNGKCHPEQVDLKWTTSSDPVQTVLPKTLQENAAYHFLLVVQKGSQTAQAEQTVHVQPDSALILNVTCIENCSKSVIPTERFCLSGKCLNCRKFCRLLYHWSLFSGSSTEIHFDWDSKTTTGRANPYICLNSLTFINVTEQSYTLVLKVTMWGNKSSVYNYLFFVNSPPLDGNCVLNPITGMACLTKFIVHCSGFKDKNLSLTYKVKAALDTLTITRMSSIENSTLGTTVYFGYLSKIPPSYLPIGVPSKQYALTIYVEVYDALGAYSRITLQTTVNGPLKGKQTDIILNELHGLTSGPRAPITSFIESGDYFSAGYFVYMVASTLNDIETLQRFHSSKTELRENLLNRSAGIPTIDIMEATQMISCIFQITQEVTEINRNSQLLAVRKLKEVSEELKKRSNKDLGSKEIKILGTVILAGLSNVLKAALLEHRNVHRNGVKETISATEILADLVLRGKVPGENETIMEAKDWTITLRKDEKRDVSGAFSKRKDCKNCFYPKMKREENDKLPVGAVVSTVLYEFDKNPFPWLPFTDDIGTMVTGFKMTGTKSNGDMIGIMPDKVEMIMNRKDRKTAIFEMMMGCDKKLSKATGEFSFEVYRKSKDVFIQIVTKLKRNFQIFIYPGLKVSHSPVASFNASHNKPVVPREKIASYDCALQTPYIFCLPQTLLRSMFQDSTAEKLNISFVLQSPLFACNQGNQLVGIVLFTADCLYLNGVQSHWKEGFCRLGPQTTWKKVHCICTGNKRTSRTANPQLRRTSYDDITFLAGKVTAYPNPVDMKRTQLAQIHKNPVTMLTVLFIFVVYIFLAIWAMRKDRADMKSRDHVIVLPDNDPFDKVCYLITIYTGSRFGAGSTADVFVQLIGERTVSDIHCLRHPEHLTFLRGAINTFLLTTKNDLGDIYCFRVWHNNVGSSPNWFLSRIKVENIYTKQSWMFMCRKWFAFDKDNGLIERSFIAAHRSEPLNKMDFFLISLSNDLVDNHLWLSIFAHVCTGSLNRLQRLSCCLAILFCILLVNIMLFSADEDLQMFSEHLQYLRPVIIGIQSAFISIPLQMIIAALFKYAQKEPSVQNATQTPPKEYSAFMSGNFRNWKERLQKWYLVETASKGPWHSFPGSSSNAPGSCKLKKTKCRPTTKGWSNCTISEGDANLIATEEDIPQDASANNNFSNNYVGKETSPQRKPMKIASMLFCKRPQITTTTWWNRYVSWMLALVISTVSSFFIIFYGLSYDYETSLEWLVASTISLGASVFLLETLNILFFSALKTLYPKYCENIPWSSKETYLEIKLNDINMDADDMRELHYDLVRMRGAKYYQPLEEDEITIFEKRQKIQHQAFVFIKDVICHFVFLILILQIAYSMENTTSFYYNQDIHNKFSLGLTDVNKVEHIYIWLREIFLPLIHNDHRSSYLSNTWSKILGLPRMRQIRAKNTKKECFYPHSFINKFVISKSHCLHKYGLDQEDQRDHLESWTNPANTSVSNNISNFSGFTYQSVTDPWKYSSYGELHTYEAGGYTFNIYPKEELHNSTKRIAILERSSWLDENTWALIVEMTTFNSDVALFCSISVVFEISHLGPINTSLLIHSYKLPIFKQLSKMEKFVYIAVGYILVFYIIDELCVVEQQRLKYIKTVSNLINFGIKGVCLFFLLQLAFKFKLASSVIELYLLHPDEFIPFHKASHVDKTLRITLGFLAFLIVLKTLRYSRFFYDVRLAQRSILAALPGICSMALVVAVYFFVYMAFGYLVFGQYEWNYNTMTHSAQTVFSYCVSAFKDTAFTSNRLLGGLFLASFMMVMICVLINLFQAVIMSAYEDMKQPVYEEPSDEAEVVNFLFHKIRRIWYFVTCRSASTTDTELFNRVLFGHPEQRNTQHLGLKARKINGRKMVYLVI
ncbi:polycystin family receptor for egg jelly [Elgaria multicarinata webbii]|uniref:polycystin family receptor for egg jelly n=1 Tax=Elgaria multicarinata webbii TaxID=159646 RepID=UPI002FCCCD36